MAQAEIKFEANYAMLKSSVYEAQVEGLHAAISDRHYLYYCALTYARRCQERRQGNESVMLDQLYTKVFLKHVDDMSWNSRYADIPLAIDDLTREESGGSDHFESFLQSAIIFNLHCYLQDKLRMNQEVPSSSVKRQLITFSLDQKDIRPETVLSLLTFGANPFLPDGEPAGAPQRFDKPWCDERFNVLQKVIGHLDHSFYPAPSPESNSQLKVWAEILRILLSHRQPIVRKNNEHLQVKSKYIETSRVVSKAFAHLPELNNELQGLMVEKSSSFCCVQ